MTDLEYTRKILELVRTGDVSMITDSYYRLTAIVLPIISHSYRPGFDEIVSNILDYSNILYNNLPTNALPLSDDIYDRLVEYAFNNGIEYNIGAPTIFLDISDESNTSGKELINPMVLVDEDDFYTREMSTINRPTIVPLKNVMNIEGVNYVNTNRRTYDTKHMYPNLVGTLRKSKKVLMKDVPEEYINDSNYRVLERDFFGNHLSNGIITPDRVFTMVLELKYDGVSVEADANSTILSARTRGDTSGGVTTDVSNLFAGRPFPGLMEKRIPDSERAGVKFEAIITKDNLARYSELKETQYKNCRSAIVGMVSSGEGELYKDLITLVPLAIDIGEPLDRLTEINIINQLFTNEFVPHWVTITGTYVENLYCIDRFLREMEVLRTTLPFMYDGIVVSYIDNDITERLERKGFVNQHQEAVKFDALKQEATFLGYSYTVGQDGKITPMIHYTPVMFMGTVHNKSTGHSLGRFNELSLSVGDKILVEYVNDVMPYVYKLEDNGKEPEKFIEECPVCNGQLEISKSGKSIKCINPLCPGIKKARIVNMLEKLNIKDFGDSRIEDLQIGSFIELMNIDPAWVDKVFPTEIMNNKFWSVINAIKTNEIMDYNIVGALGFDNIAESSWKAILSKVTIEDIINAKDLRNILSDIPGIGDTKIETIIRELPSYIDDLIYINNMDNVKNIKDITSPSYKIRYTGVRDAEFTSYLKSKLHDVGEGSVTKDTDILIIPNEDYASSKVDKAIQYGITIMTLEDAKAVL